MRAIGAIVALLLVCGTVPADEVAVTVYNGDLGVVSENRQLEFQESVGRLAFRDVPARIDAASVRFGILDTRQNVTILEQNYAYDLVKPEQLYQKYLDHDIELVDKEGRLYAGKLLAYGGGAVTLHEAGGRVKVVQLSNVTEVNFPSLPEGLITRPTLFWLYQSDFQGSVNCNVSYQTTGLDWAAEYVGVLAPDEKQLHLSGWGSINNRCGKTFKDATLKLVAGDIGRATPPPRRMAKSADMEMMAGAGFEEKEFFEYHLYTLPRKATLADNEIKQISLFEPAETPVEKIFVYRPERNPRNVEVALKFTNSASAGLGMPLPEGRVRIFKADDDGSLILLGEDRIQHTPKDEELKLRVGYAFDVVAEERLMDQNRITRQVEERQYEMELRNRKDEPVTIKVEKKLYGDWDVLEASHQYERKDASTLIFDVLVGAGETVIIRLKVRFNYQ